MGDSQLGKIDYSRVEKRMIQHMLEDHKLVVVMQNDFPVGVFINHGEADEYVESKKAELAVCRTLPRIHFHKHEFVLNKGE